MPRSTTARWVSALRAAVAGECPKGWLVSEQSGRVKVTVKYSDGTRSSAMLPIPWEPACVTPTLNALTSVRASVEAGRPLKEAIALLAATADGEAPAAPGAVNWPQLVERFRYQKLTTGALAKESTWNWNYAPTMRQVVEVMTARSAPKTGKQLLQALVDQFGGVPGSRGRHIRLQQAAALLRFGVEEIGVEQRWMPPASISELVGRAPAGHNTGNTDSTPLKDQQLTRLLECITEPHWRLAIELMACFGLRPIELRFIRPSADGTQLHCSYCKRTSKGSTSARDIVGLDPAGHPGMSARLLAQLAAIGRVPGATKLPRLGNLDRRTAGAIDTFLRRKPIWMALKAEVEAAGENLTVYSFRHGYALRAHEFGLMPRAAAALMGHGLQTHSQHYGQWTDRETIVAAVARTAAAQELRHAEALNKG